MLYTAEWDGGRTFLSKDEQLDKYLALGANIYAVENVASTEKTLVATPADGFLVERPSLVIKGGS